MFEPCPFCAGARAEVVEVDVGAWMVECMECHTTGPIGKSTAAAEERWNDRQLSSSSVQRSSVTSSQRGVTRPANLQPK